MIMPLDMVIQANVPYAESLLHTRHRIMDIVINIGPMQQNKSNYQFTFREFFEMAAVISITLLVIASGILFTYIFFTHCISLTVIVVTLLIIALAAYTAVVGLIYK